MKISRQKKVRKSLNFYIHHFKFHQPYQVLIDGTFTLAALKNKFNIKEQLSKYFQGEVKLLTTQCVILETEKLGPKLHGAMLIVKQFAVHKCGHEKEPVLGSKCLKSMVKDTESRYVVATQDRLLQERLRKVPGVPIMYLHGNAPTLEIPSKASKVYIENLKKKLLMSDLQAQTIKTLKKQSGLQTDSTLVQKKKKQKGGPNPLSCKKKKKGIEPNTKANQSDSIKGGKIHKRKRIKIASHVKEALKSKA